MNFKNTIDKILNFAAVACLFLTLACSSDKESQEISQHLQAHQSEIVSIEIDTDQELVLRTGQSMQFQAYGLLEDGSRLQTEPNNEGNTSDQTINNLVNWSVDDTTLAEISNRGLLSDKEIAGSVTVIANFAGQEATESVAITDAVLAEIIIDTTVTSIEACRNLELTATGVLADGNEITLETGTLVWSAENNEVGEFKNEAVGELSTFLSGSVDVTAEDSSGEVVSSPVSIMVTNGLQAVTLSNTVDNMLEVSKSIEITATGVYADGEFDITENSTLLSRDEDLATFEDNILTAKTEAGILDVTGTCDLVVGTLEITVVLPGS